MRRLIIAVDCDDVLISTTPYLIDVYNKRYGTQVTLARSHESDMAIWGLTDKRAILDRLSEIQLSEEYATLEPSDDGISAVRRLAAHHELHLVTARDPKITDVTLAMLDNYLHGCFSSVEHVGGHGKSKGEVCQQLHADILIDDNIKHLVSALEHGMRPNGAIHFGSYAWNQTEAGSSDIVRCRNWDEVERRVEELAKQ